MKRIHVTRLTEIMLEGSYAITAVRLGYPPFDSYPPIIRMGTVFKPGDYPVDDDVRLPPFGKPVERFGTDPEGYLYLVIENELYYILVIQEAFDRRQLKIPNR